MHAGHQCQGLLLQRCLSLQAVGCQRIGSGQRSCLVWGCLCCFELVVVGVVTEVATEVDLEMQVVSPDSGQAVGRDVGLAMDQGEGQVVDLDVEQAMDRDVVQVVDLL